MDFCFAHWLSEMAEITNITASELHTPCEEPEPGRRICSRGPFRRGRGQDA